MRRWTILMAAWGTTSSAAPSVSPAAPGVLLAYVCPPSAEGFAVYAVDGATGAFEPLGFTQTDCQGALAASGDVVYRSSPAKYVDGRAVCALHTYRADPASGHLRPIDTFEVDCRRVHATHLEIVGRQGLYARLAANSSGAHEYLDAFQMQSD